MSSVKPILLVLASTFPRWKNDTEPRFVYDLCQRLKDEYEIIVLAPHCHGSQIQEELDGLQIIRYRYAPKILENLAYEGGITAKLKGNKLNWLVLPFFFLGQWLAIIRLLKRYPVKVIHAHWLIPQGVLALTAQLISANKPAILCTSHGGDLYSLNDPISKAIKRYVISNVDALTVVSATMQDEIKRLVPSAKIPMVAPMGTDLEKLFTPDDSIQREPNKLLFVGRLVEKKGLKYLLEALPEIIKEHLDVTLTIVGTGPEQTRLEKQVSKLAINKHVYFLGRLTHDQLVQHYRTATIAVFPFVQASNGDREGLGLVTIEAQGCGCPVIVSDIPAVQDIIKHDETGILTPSEHSEKLSGNIKKLLSSPEHRKYISKQAQQNVLKKFSWDSSAEIYSLLLQKISVKINRNEE